MLSKETVKLVFRSLRHRNYRLFFCGQGVSMLGSWIQQTAYMWMVYKMTDSERLLGLVGFVSQMPILMFSLFAGVVADRFNKRKIIISTQVSLMILSATLATLTLTKVISVWHIIAISAVTGIINAFDMSARQSFVVELVDKKDLHNAIALNSSLFNIARLIGPTIAGFLIPLIGAGHCFSINTATFLAVIGAMLMIRVPPHKNHTRQTDAVKNLLDGIKYSFHIIPIRVLLLFAGVTSLCGVSYGVFMPVFAKDVLKGDAKMLGYLLGSAGAGALSGAILMASRKNVLGLARWIAAASMIFALGLIGFSLSTVPILSMFFVYQLSLGLMVQMSSINTMLQTMVDDDKRGRVMSLFVMAFIGISAIGSIIIGFIAGFIGAPITLTCCGVMCLVASIIFTIKLQYLRDHVRPIYMRLGLVPSAAKVVPVASDIDSPG